MNKFIGIGNLTRDPENGETNSGISFCRFTIAVQRKFKNEKNKYETDFLNCTAWRNIAEFISKYFKKGDKICVVGSIQNRAYNGQNGEKKYTTDIIVDEAELASQKANNDEKQAFEKQNKPKQTLIPIDDKDEFLPF